MKKIVLDYKEKHLEVVSKFVIENKLENIYELLFDSKIDLNTPCAKKYTLLTWALRCNNMTASKRLIELGADINQRDASGRSPLFAAMPYLSMHRKENYDNLHIEMIEYLVTRTEYEILKEENVLHLAIDCKDIEIVKCVMDALRKRNLLDEFSKQKNYEGLNPIHKAVRGGLLDIIKLFVTFEYFEENIFHIAAKYADPAVVSYLVEIVRSNGNVSIKKYLEHKDFDGTTALFNAVCRADKSLEVVKFLIDLNANRYVVDFNGRTIFHYALMGKKLDIFRYLIELTKEELRRNDAFLKQIFNRKDLQGKTLLHYVIELQDDETGLKFVKLLIEDYVNHKAADKEGNSVLHLAASALISTP